MAANEIAEVQQASAGAVTLSHCDITDEGAVKRWARDVATQTDGGLDLLINNAGILTPGPLEVLPLDAIRREFEVNVFGALSVMNAFLPALRKTRGRILQISTWTASLPLPFNGQSGASKAAMEVFAAVFRAELKSLGIDVVVAAAGNMRTGGRSRKIGRRTGCIPPPDRRPGLNTPNDQKFFNEGDTYDCARGPERRPRRSQQGQCPRPL
jgi:NAD(P)-dependent dehydrogenase (short-subunit alcohol dehydrogenase family)